MQITGTCTGFADDPLVKSITIHQTALQHPIIDGRISVATGDGRVGPNAFFILRLSARLSDMFPQAWPRLDLIPTCPALVAAAVKDCIPRVNVG